MLLLLSSIVFCFRMRGEILRGGIRYIHSQPAAGPDSESELSITSSISWNNNNNNMMWHSGSQCSKCATPRSFAALNVATYLFLQHSCSYPISRHRRCCNDIECCNTLRLVLSLTYFIVLVAKHRCNDVECCNDIECCNDVECCNICFFLLLVRPCVGCSTHLKCCNIGFFLLLVMRRTK
jgi:hypothetical protein